MKPRIAIPMPHSTDREYGERAILQYERAVALAGGEPVRVPLDRPEIDVRNLIADCDGVLLPGSKADIDPLRFKQTKSQRSAAADRNREEVDDLLLEDAYTHRKPVLGICYGLQSLNVHRNGSLVQHIPDFLPEETRAKVNHEAGRKVTVAHAVEIDRGSRLAEVLASRAVRRSAGQPGTALPTYGVRLTIPVNSSHHQSAEEIGDGLRIVARCPDDGIIEAVEGTAPDHFVLAVQWHPERSVEEDAASSAILHGLTEACQK